ncbi:MAG: FMN-binding negative transcriptional regulator [Gemmatimonadaceae bacterium]
MYIPRLNAEQDTTALRVFIGANPFATLVTASGGLFATHLPLILRVADGPLGTLEGHVARANMHHKLVDGATDALVIFSGPHGHITPTWYPSKIEDDRVVPTWNYVAVHAYGIARFRDDAEFLAAHVARLTERHESARGSDWRTDDPPSEYLAQQLKAIVGVEIEITKLEGKWKMSQNRSMADVDGVIEGLRQSGDAQDREVADTMEQRRAKPE